MKRLLATTLVAVLALTALSSVSFAGANANAKIQLHLLAPTTKAACTRLTATPACTAINVHGNLYPSLYYAYVLVTDANATAGIAGLQFGITYNGAAAAGVDIYAWTLCATLEFQQPTPVWPSNGGGNLITWDYTTRCQRFVPAGNDPVNGVVANAGYFYLASYTSDVMTITPRPVDGMAKVADCAAAEDNIEGTGLVRSPSHLGSIGFGAGQGYNPCGLVDPVPVEQTTWGAVKSLYGTK